MDRQTAADRPAESKENSAPGQQALVLSTNRVEMEPGGAPVDVVATIYNTGQVVESYTFEISGLSPGWFTAPVLGMKTFPGDHDEVRITLHPPKREQGGIVKAGLNPFKVIVTAGSGAQNVGEVILDLRGQVTYQLDLKPRIQTARRFGRFRLQIANSGNADGRFGVEGHDAEELCQIKFPRDAEPMAVAAKMTEVPFIVQPKHRPWFGPVRTYDFSVSARPLNARGQPQTVLGQYTYKPLLKSFPIWTILKWLLIICVVLIALVVLVSSRVWDELGTRTQIALAQACGTQNLYRVPVLGGACPSPCPAGNDCNNPDACVFALGFQEFAQDQRSIAVGPVAISPRTIVGHCLTNEYYDRFGNGHQQTTRGFLFWDKASNTVYFFIRDSVFRYYDRDLKLVDGSGHV